MRKLMNANFARLWKEKMFWLAFVFMTIGSVCFSWMSYTTAMKNSDLRFYVEDMMFNMLPMMDFVLVFFISMRLGTEFDEHTIRKKLVVGYNRTQVYFAEYIICMVASLILLFAMLLFSGLSGYFLFREFQLGWMEVTFLVLCCVLMASVFSAMNVGICMNVRSKATSLVASIIFLFIILFTASFCINALEEEPTGQTIQLNNLDYERAARWPLLSVFMLFIATVTGYMSFCKRDIR